MAASRLGRVQKSMALVVLSAATASLAGVGLTSGSEARGGGSSLPDGTTIPTEPIEVPASVTRRGAIAPAVRDQVVGTSGIPAAALTAYQRAESVINAADRACRLPWALIAAIGRVESDHGRFGGNTLSPDGVATPGIYGIALDGTNGTSVIRDTDAGLYDNDAIYDRAVGPMQFIPSTWSVVGVDADGDARRNPQDIDDAALASAVYLCSGSDALDADAGRRSSVYRYNHSQRYVDLVLSIMNTYLRGDYTAVPNGSTSTSHLPDDSGNPPAGHHGPGHRPSSPSSPTGPTNPPTDGVGGPTSDPTPGPTPGPTPQPTPDPTPNPAEPADPVDPLPSPAGDVLSHAEAVVQCTLDGHDPVLDPAGWDQSIYDYTH